MTDILFITLLIIASVIDIKKREIPNFVPVDIAVLSLFNMYPLGLLAALPFFIAAYLHPESIGGGDIKLTAAVGLYMGLYSTTFGLMTGLCACIIYHCISTKKSKSLPLAPFLSLGFIITIFGGI